MANISPAPDLHLIPYYLKMTSYWRFYIVNEGKYKSLPQLFKEYLDQKEVQRKESARIYCMTDVIQPPFDRDNKHAMFLKKMKDHPDKYPSKKDETFEEMKTRRERRTVAITFHKKDR